jgi:hypothetical protein
MERSHLVNLYRPQSSAQRDAYGKSRTIWEPEPYALNVPCNLQPLKGDVESTAAGREVDVSWKGFFPPEVTIEPDVGVVVVQNLLAVEVPDLGPWRFRVKIVNQQGAKWDTEVLLNDTPENIPHEIIV